MFSTLLSQLGLPLPSASPYFTTIFSGMLVAFAVYQSRLTKQYYFSASALGNLHSLLLGHTAAAKYAGRRLPRKTSRRWADGATVAQYLTVGLLVTYTRSPTVGPGDTALFNKQQNGRRTQQK